MWIEICFLCLGCAPDKNETPFLVILKEFSYLLKKNFITRFPVLQPKIAVQMNSPPPDISREKRYYLITNPKLQD